MVSTQWVDADLPSKSSIIKVEPIEENSADHRAEA
jgi:hypothetical protein